MRRASQSVRGVALAASVVALSAPVACSVLLPLSDYDRDTDKVVLEAGGPDANDAASDGGDSGGEAGCPSAGDNCGECGRSCLGDSCIDGRCAPKHVLAPVPVIALTVTDTAVFASTGIVGPNIIGKLPLDLDTTQFPSTLDTNDAGATALTVGGDRLFWGDTAGVISSVTLDLANASRRVDSDAGPPFVAQVGGYLGPRWTSPDRAAGGVFGAGGVVRSAPGAWGMVIDNDETFYGTRISPGTIRVIRTAGEETLVADAGIPIGIAVDAAAVYWADCLGGSIRRFDRRSRAVTTLAQGQAYPFALIADGDYVYWTTIGTAASVVECEKLLPDKPSANGEVVRVRKDGTGKPLVLARDQALPISLSARAGQGYVYWGAAIANASGGVWRTAK